MSEPDHDPALARDNLPLFLHLSGLEPAADLQWSILNGSKDYEGSVMLVRVPRILRKQVSVIGPMLAILMVVIATGISAANDRLFDRAVRDYEKGNHEAAEQVFRKLADDGYPPAQYNLGVMYTRGEVVTKSFVEAYKWFTLAAGKRYENAKKSRSAVRRLMSEDQITQAQASTQAWKDGRKK